MLFQKKNYCCDQLEEKMNGAGHKGFAVILSFYDNIFGFLLQFRSVDFERSKEVSNSTGEMGIKYCPWCGKKLSKSIDKRKLTELVEKHRHLVHKF